MRSTRLIPLALLASCASVALAACNQSSSTAASGAAPVAGAPTAALPLSDASGPPPPPAPATSALPYAAPAALAPPPPPVDQYRYIDDAYDLGDAFADSPPDYTVDYDGAEPWVWQAGDGSYRVVEQTPDGERFYYYRAGSDQPFLVRDHDHAYAYDHGQLAVIYDSRGRPLGRSAYESQADVAGRLLLRAGLLFAAVSHNQHQPPQAAQWQARGGGVQAVQRQWAAQRRSDPDWRKLQEQTPQDAHAPWAQEAARRQAYVAQLPSNPQPGGPRPGPGGPPAPAAGPAAAPPSPTPGGPQRHDPRPPAAPAVAPGPDQRRGPEPGVGQPRERRPEPVAPEPGARPQERAPPPPAPRAGLQPREEPRAVQPPRATEPRPPAPRDLEPRPAPAARAPAPRPAPQPAPRPAPPAAGERPHPDHQPPKHDEDQR